MTILQSLRAYFVSCPALASDLGADFLDRNVGAFALEALPSQEVVTAYTDGGALRRFLFLISSRCSYGRDAVENMDNGVPYEEVCAWLKAQEAAGNLPQLTEGRQAVRLRPLTGGYVLEGEGGTARYQMQLEMIYYEGGN